MEINILFTNTIFNYLQIYISIGHKKLSFEDCCCRIYQAAEAHLNHIPLENMPSDQQVCIIVLWISLDLIFEITYILHVVRMC